VQSSPDSINQASSAPVSKATGMPSACCLRRTRIVCFPIACYSLGNEAAADDVTQQNLREAVHRASASFAVTLSSPPGCIDWSLIRASMSAGNKNAFCRSKSRSDDRL